MVPEKTPSILGQSAGARGAEECTERVAASTAPHRTATKALYGGWWTWFQFTHQLPPQHLGTALLNIYLSTVSGRRTKKNTCDGWAELPTHAAVSPTRVSHLDASDDEGEM